jgi:5-enolpyruvylshikimate-3-phosphate synthase
MTFRVYPHIVNDGRNICKADTFIRVKDVERIKELTKELEKYGLITELEDAIEQQTNLHLIVKIPYKWEKRNE